MTMPLHERIRADVRRRILSGALAPGHRLPTELELMAEYGCSRMTVSKALSTLAASGLIDRRKRAGSFVGTPRVHSMVLDVPDLPQEVAARGQSYGYRLIERKVKRIRSTSETLLDVGIGPVLELSGVHFGDGRPFAVEDRLVSLLTVPGIRNASFETDPPGTWLLRHVAWTEAETRILAVGADARSAALLGIDPATPLLVIERRTLRGENRITAVRQAFRGDLYDLFARFSQDSRKI